MATLTEIRAGIASALSAIPGMRSGAYLPDNPTPPFALVEPLTADYHSTYGNGMVQFEFKITVVVQRSSERTAQGMLDGFVANTGTSSVRQALELDRTLGGKVFDAKVSGATSIGAITISETTYLAAEFNLVVLTN